MSDWDVVEQQDAQPAAAPASRSAPNDEWEVVEPRAQAPQQAQFTPVENDSERPESEWAVASTEPVGGGEDEPTAVGSFARAAARAAPVGAASGVGALQAGGVGAALGSAAGPVGTVAGGLAGGLAGAIGYGWIANWAEDKLLAALGWDKPINEQMAKDKAAHPYAQFGGELAGGVLPAFGLGAVPRAARAIGAGAGAGFEAGMELYHGEPLDPLKIGMSGAANAIAAKPRAWAEGAANRITPAAYRHGNIGGENPNPDHPPEAPVEEPHPGEAFEFDVPETKSAGPAPTPTPDTVEMAKANDQTLTAGGVAEVQHPAPELPGVGNPEGAPMVAREGARPSDATRDYEKKPTPSDQAPSVLDNQSPIAPDVAEAMRGVHEEQVPQPDQARPDVRQPPEAAPTNPEPAPRPVEPVQHTLPETTPEPRPTGLTPAEIKASLEAHRMLKEAGYNRVLAEIARRGLGPRETAAALQKARTALESKSGEAIGRTEERLRPEAPRPTLSSGAMARSKADAAAKEARNKVVLDAFKEFGPGSERGTVDLNDTKAVRTFAKAAMAELIERNNGVNPAITPSPRLQTPEMADAFQWIKALNMAANPRKPTTNFKTLHAQKGMGELSRETGKVEGDIAHRPQLEEAAGEAETASGERPTGREFFDPLPPERGRNGEILPHQRTMEENNALREWVNDLSNEDYERLNEHYDLRAELADPDYPPDLQAEMQKFLEKPSRRVLKDQPATLAPAEEPKGGEVKVIDRNSEAGKKLYAEYNEKINTPIPEDHAERLKFEEQNLKEAEPAIKQFLRDEKGGLTIPWLKKQPNSMTSPDREVHAKEIAESLGNEFSEFSKGLGVITSRMRQMAALSPKFASRKAARDAYQEAYRHLEDNPDPAKDLSIKDNKVFDIVHLTRKMTDEYNKALALIRFHDPEGEIIKLPPSDKMQPYEKGFLNRLRTFDKTSDDLAPDPFAGTERQLSTWRGPLEDRTFKVLSDGKGLRVLFNQKDSGGVQIWHNGRPVDRSVPISFEGHVGDKVTVNVNKKPVDMTVDNATAREITKHARDEKGNKIIYHENPILATANAVIQANQALETMKLLRSVRDNPQLRDVSAFGGSKEALKKINENDLVQTKLKQFQQLNGKDWFMPRRVKEALDDYRQAGLDEDSLNWLSKANVNLMKSLWVVSPLIHGFNVGAAWVPQRGFDLLSPKGNMWLAKTTAKAIHAVVTQDMKVLEPAMKNNLTMMLPGTKNTRLMQAIAKRGGEELLAKNPKWWDAMIYPEWGLRAGDVGREMLKYANTITWGMSDVMTLQRYLENVERRGMWPKDAAAEAHQWLPDYHVPTRVAESTINKIPGVSKEAAGAVARSTAKLLRSPALSLFGPYHYDLFKTLARTTRGVVNGNPKAAGQLMALAVGTYLVYPYLLDKAAQQITDNEHASVGRRGPLAPFQAIGDALGANHMVNSVITMLGGKPAPMLVNPPKLSTDIYMAPPILKTFLEGVANKDFTSHQIYPTSIEEGNRLGWSKASRHVLDWAASSLLPPYQMLSSEVKKRGEKSSFGARLIEEQFGIREPTPGAVKFQYQQPKTTNKELKYRMRREGPLEGLF